MDKQTVRVVGTERSSLTNNLRAEYEKGASIRQLAESTGRSYGFVHRILTESGVSLRGRGGPKKRATAA